MLNHIQVPASNWEGDRIAFFGPQCVGKTFLANDLVREGYEKIAFADRLKALAKELFGVEGKDGEARIILQKLGTALRELDENVWINPVLKRVAAHPDGKWVVDDVRYPNEVDALRQAGFMLIRVTVPETLRLQRIYDLYPNTLPESYKHISETALARYYGDERIDSVDGMALATLQRLIHWDR